MTTVIVIGAGPAGLLAAGRAAERGAAVILLEKNPQPGRKLLLTGAGRCNVTNQASLPDFIEQFFGQGRFLYPALQYFFRPELLDLLARHGTPCQLEHAGKYFPRSNKAADVLAALMDYAVGQGVRLVPDCAVTELLPATARKSIGVVCRQGPIQADTVILATGGSSYPGTGSNGDGFRLAASVGHTIIPVRPALVPLTVVQPWVMQLAGLSLPMVEACLLRNERVIARSRGDLLLTHTGVSGPAVLRLSRYLAADPADWQQATWQLRLNLLPDYKPAELTAVIRDLLRAGLRQQLKNAIGGLLPQRLVEPLLNHAGLPADKVAGQVSQSLAEAVAKAIQGLDLTVTGSRGFTEAMVTAGGVSLKEVQPQTMASRLVSNLFLAGEVLDLDGDTGGYNLQAAFSTGWLAGTHAADPVR